MVFLNILYTYIKIIYFYFLKFIFNITISKYFFLNRFFSKKNLFFILFFSNRIPLSFIIIKAKAYLTCQHISIGKNSVTGKAPFFNYIKKNHINHLAESTRRCFNNKNLKLKNLFFLFSSSNHIVTNIMVIIVNLKVRKIN